MSKLCSLPPKTLRFENHLHPFELLHRDVLYYDCNTNESLIPLTMKIKDIHLSPFWVPLFELKRYFVMNIVN